MIPIFRTGEQPERNLMPIYPIRKIPENKHKVDSQNVKIDIHKLNEDIIGAESGFSGPFGWKQYTYVDHTASGKALKSVESFIESEVLPHYANTHTTVSNTSHQTTILRKEARDIIKQSVGASQDDEVIFCGAGSTSAVHKLLHHVTYPENKRLVVFIGPFEHHSNILPWREKAAQVIQVPVNQQTGNIDLDFLAKNLKKVTKSGNKDQLIVGSFSGGSNVTGVLTDDVKVTELLHEHGALAFWDYAAAAPHVPINMNPASKYGMARKDALFFSGHKFLGGPQTPGVLVVKSHVLHNPFPHGVGGGTVVYTSRTSQKYLWDAEEREEGGTPNIVGSIRLGLVFKVRNKIGIDAIMEREASYCRRVLREWAQVPEIHVLGCAENPRLPIISFMIQHIKSGYYLHHNFVVALLNDLFGIQCRGGCMCAGPYGEVLLGFDMDAMVKRFSLDKESTQKDDLAAKYSSIMKPGFVRISLNFHSSEAEVDFLIKAVKMVARHGWKLLPFYKICMNSASFVFNTKLLERDANYQVQLVQHTSLNSFDPLYYSSQKTEFLQIDAQRSTYFDFNECLTDVESIIKYVKTSLDLTEVVVSTRPKNFPLDSYQSHKQKKSRWFMIQHESALLQQKNNFSRSSSPPGFLNPLKIIFKTPTWTEKSVPFILSAHWNGQINSDSIEVEDEDGYWESYYNNVRVSGVWPRYDHDLRTRK